MLPDLAANSSTRCSLQCWIKRRQRKQCKQAKVTKAVAKGGHARMCMHVSMLETYIPHMYTRAREATIRAHAQFCCLPDGNVYGSVRAWNIMTRRRLALLTQPLYCARTNVSYMCMHARTKITTEIDYYVITRIQKKTNYNSNLRCKFHSSFIY